MDEEFLTGLHFRERVVGANTHEPVRLSPLSGFPEMQ